MAVHDTDLFGESVAARHASALAKTWDYPPFSVLSARDGWWQERKRAWLALGIQSELGRGAALIPNGGGMATKARYDDAAPGGALMPSTSYSKDRARGDSRGKPIGGGKIMGAAFDTRHGLQTWQKDRRNG